MSKQSLQDTITQIQTNIKRFEKIEGKSWGIEGAVIELAKQVGQLSALVMNKEGYYFEDRDKADTKYISTNDKIGDELADILLYSPSCVSRHITISTWQR